jgi:hypothetical protein
VSNASDSQIGQNVVRLGAPFHAGWTPSGRGNMLRATAGGVLDGGVRQGFGLTRLVAQMEWALEGRPGVDDLVEYETRLNDLLRRYRDAVV